MGIGLVPLAGGLVLGMTHTSLTVPLTTQQAVMYPVIGVGSFALSGLLAALFFVAGHFLDEADGAAERERRIAALRAERDSLRPLTAP